MNKTTVHVKSYIEDFQFPEFLFLLKKISVHLHIIVIINSGVQNEIVDTLSKL